MASINMSKLVTVVKGGAGHSAAAQKMGLTPGQLSMLVYCKAKVDAGLAKKAPKTAASVKQLRDKENERWEMIAARVGGTVTEVKNLYGGEDAAKASYTGRGRNWLGGGSTSNGRKTKAASKKATSKGGSKAASKKASSKKSASKKASTRPIRARTLAERRASRSAANPS